MFVVNNFMIVFLSDFLFPKVIKYKYFLFDYGNNSNKDYFGDNRNKDSFGLFTLENFVSSLVCHIDLGVDYQVYVKFTSDKNHSPGELDINYMFRNPVMWGELGNICVDRIEDRDYINDYFDSSYKIIDKILHIEACYNDYYPVYIEVFLVENK